MSSESFYQVVSRVVALSIAVCAVCGSHDRVQACPTCHRQLCDMCTMDTCKGCDADVEFESGEGVRSFPLYGVRMDEPGESLRMVTSTGDLMVWHYMEKGTLPLRDLVFPSKDQWKTVESILMTYILFTTSSVSIHKPIPGYRYLVGSAHHVYSNRASARTDYIMVWDPEYDWGRYMVTYYDQSPMRHDKNVFYPLPLPLQFE